MGDVKVILVGDETQLDVKPFQILKEQYHQVQWVFKKIIPASSPEFPTLEPHVEIRRKDDTLFFPPIQTNWRSIPSDLRPARICTDGDKPVDLYQRGTFGSCLSSIRTRALWPTQGNFIAKGAPRYYQSRLFNGELIRVSTTQNNGPSLRFRLRLSCTFVLGIRGIPSFIGNALLNSMSSMPL